MKLHKAYDQETIFLAVLWGAFLIFKSSILKNIVSEVDRRTYHI